jgi:hypothetical protein
MLHQIIFNVTFYGILFKIDRDLAELTRTKRCPYCGGPLHRAFYERSPRGGPDRLPREYAIRLGLCCGHCRCRTLPPSSLFLGRKQHWGAIVLVVTMVRQKRPGGQAARKLMEKLNVSQPTLVRWMRYFQEEYPATGAWKKHRSRVGLQVSSNELPGSLVDYFIKIKKDNQGALAACLCFLACGRTSPGEQAC